MDDGLEVTPPAFLDGFVRTLRLRDHDLLLVEVPQEWSDRFGEADRWAHRIAKEMQDVHGVTVTAVVLPPGMSVGHYRPVDVGERPDGHSRWETL